MASKGERATALRFIVGLGVVSLFADMTYEGARSILGPYLKELGASATQVGLIAGFGEMMAAGLRLFSGRLVDRTRAYWTITFLGYVVNLAAVPALALAGNWPMAALLIAIERTGKSIRGPARDVLLSEATGKVGHGWGFGLHNAMDQVGAVAGPLLVAAAVSRSGAFGPAFLLLAWPAAAALAALAAARALRPRAAIEPPPEVPQQALPRLFWRYVAASALLAFGYADFALLAYRLQSNHLASPAVIPLLYAAMAVDGLAALAAGRLFDRFGVRVIAGGILISVLALPLGFLGGTAAAVAGIACWAAGTGLQEATLRPGIAQAVSMNRRGSAFGAFNAVYGVAWFLGSAAMGFLYDRSPVALVAFGAAAQLGAAALFFRLRAAPQLR